MENYTKFKLKRKEELTPFLEDKDNLFILACNKCFKEFEIGDEPECSNLEQLAKEQGKTVVGSAKIDFLCNETLTSKLLQSIVPEEAEDIFVISCGLGIQTVAEQLENPVYAASDTISVDGQHGMALTTTLCDACGQCYLNLTGGICPIVDCAKSLLNGQCGGAKDGKCEVDKNKDCAWEKIYNKMESLGRLDELLAQQVEVRDYSKINHKFINQYVTSVRESRFEGYYGGVHPSEKKEFSENIDLVSFPEPRTVVIPLSQHAGAPADLIVEVGQTVKVGQKLAEANGFVSSPIHSSVSGTVVAVEPRLHPIQGIKTMAVVIQSDGENSIHESVKPAKDLNDITRDEIIELIREKGIVGMGGAGFPTSVKLKAPQKVHTVLLNGCECEPMLTADHKLMTTYPEEIIFGMKTLIKGSGAEKGVIVIEDNKHDAIEILEAKTADIPNIEVAVVKTKYPQGAEKMLVKRMLGVEIPSGGFPTDVGALVANVSTAKAVSDAMQTGMPLVERIVSVTGERIKNPGNYLVKNGTSVKDIIEHCGGVKGDDTTIKLGGPMMGFEVRDLNVPVIKSTNGVIAVETKVSEAVECIKCGRCVDVCPMELKPLYYTKYAPAENWEGMKEQNVMDCIECGSCSYICSSKIPIVDRIKIGKKAIREGK
ncbi:electron transport complex subunit RsxC [Alkalibacter mobilis]|uniref:electron transport complex subunit RsxC n=1 Tax=Alkalibacter mobilis TaxID=2787712 RepID=UPI00189D4B22|nr:electron transport complex subunit RsxC [Alkalibacter mobilis]MBF7096797.1 electron transport complex subunit RsxC [Alkalibacter mobilis]